MPRRRYFIEDKLLNIEREEEQEKHIEKLRRLILRISEQLRKEKIPVDDGCRVSFEAFEVGRKYSQGEIRKDKGIVKGYLEQWYPGLEEDEIEKQRMEKSGEQLEMLKTIIFNKYLPKKYKALRSCLYDDIKNGVDNIIINTETGDVVCATDEVISEFSSSGYDTEYRDKSDKILKKNRKKGGVLKYGIRIENGRIILGQITNIPLFLLALPMGHLKKGIENLPSRLEEKSDYERKIFRWFISSIDLQIKTLNLEESYLSEELLKRMTIFGKDLQELSKRV